LIIYNIENEGLGAGVRHDVVLFAVLEGERVCSIIGDGKTG